MPEPLSKRPKKVERSVVAAKDMELLGLLLSHLIEERGALVGVDDFDLGRHLNSKLVVTRSAAERWLRVSIVDHIPASVEWTETDVSQLAAWRIAAK